MWDDCGVIEDLIGGVHVGSNMGLLLSKSGGQVVKFLLTRSDTSGTSRKFLFSSLITQFPAHFVHLKSFMQPFASSYHHFIVKTLT